MCSENILWSVLFLAATVALSTPGALAQFETRSTTMAGSEPMATAVGDFNGDGKLDIAAADFEGTVTILLGNGDGTFRAGSSYPIGTEAVSIVAADFRHSRVLDLAVASEFDSDIYVLLGNGDGTFQQAVAYPTNGYSPGVTVGDFTGDGELDIAAITNSVECSCISVLPGNGDGTFGTPITTAVPYNITAFALGAGHFNRDGKLDLAVAGEFGSGKLDILLGNGDGTFEAFGFYQVTNSSNGITIADFNGDNKADIAISSGLGDLIVLLGNGDGTFKAPVTYPAPFLVSVAAQDFDGDGMVDLAAGANETPDGIAVFKGNGDGTFQAPRVYSANGGAGGVAVGDFNGDHLPDIVAASAAINSTFTLLNTGVVAFTPTTPLAFPFQLFNTTSAPKSVNLTNNGTTALTITSMTVKGQFGMTSTCGSSVSPGGNCKISVTFSPLSKGMKSGLITINDSASTKPQVIGLTGQGTVAQLSPSSLNFGSQKVGTKSAPQTVTLTNQGTTALSITNISVGGTNAKDFPETNNCPSSLNAGANCTITVTFDPSKTGTRKAQVSITDNGGGSPQTVPLTGTGT